MPLTRPNWVEEHPIRLAVFALVLFALVGTVYKNLEIFRKITDSVFQIGITVEPRTNSVALKTWLFLSVLFLVFSLVLAILLYIQSEMRRRALLTDDFREGTRRTLDGMMGAAAKIRDQLITHSKAPMKSFCFVKITYFIYTDYTAEVHREYSVTCSEQQIHWWTLSNNVTEYATPIPHLLNIGFKAADLGDKDVAYLPTRNDGRSKEVMMCFLPRIEAGEKPPRHVEVTYRWPQLARQMAVKGYEDFTFNFESKETIPLVELYFYIEPGIGKNFVLERTGPVYEGETLKAAKITHDNKEWSGWVYTVKDAPAGLQKYKVRAKFT